MSWFKKLTGEGEMDGPKKEQFKKLKLLAAGLVVGVCLLFWGSFGEDKKENAEAPQPGQLITQVQQDQSKVQKTAMAAEEDYLAEKLRNMLEQVAGAGKVQVTVRLETSTQTQYAVNTTTSKKTTQEKDQGGATRTLTEDTDTGQLVLVNRSGEQIPVMSREMAPQVAGVLVVAEGAENPKVKEELFRATQVSLGIEPHKVIVMAKEAGE